MGAFPTDLATLLARPRPGRFDLWLDLQGDDGVSALAALGLDGARHGGLPWRLDGRTQVRLRHLPRPGDRASYQAACAVEAARAWAVLQNGRSLPLDYDVPWALAASLLRDRRDVARFGLAHIAVLAAHEGEWLGDWVLEHVTHPAVQALVRADAAAAARVGVRRPPAAVVDGLVVDAVGTALREGVLAALLVTA